MLDLDKAVFDLRNGSINLKDILAQSSNLTHLDQFKLVLSDQYYRISQGLPCDANHYIGMVPWIAKSPGYAIELIVWQLSPELKNANLAILHEELTRQLELIGSEYKAQLDQAMQEWRFALPDDDELDRLASDFETRREQGEAPRIELWLLLVPPAHRGKFLMRLIDIEAFQLGRQNASIDWPSYRIRFPEYDVELDRAEKKLGKDSVGDQSNRCIREIFETASSVISTKIYEPAISEGVLFRGRFQIEREIGRGSFGKVLLALDQTINRYVAIKIVNKESSQSQANKPEDQMKEARLCGSLDHPNIVPVYDADVLENGGYFIVSRFIDGGTLKNEIEKDHIELRRIATLIESIASALHAVHRKGIIHRDIKPANILIERETQKAYVTDFGLATSEEDLKEKRKPAGSAPYKSPEQIRGEGHRLSGRSDLFSVGTMMYEMLCGTRPFQGSSFEQIQKQILDYDPPSPMTLKPEIPLELDRICMKLLRKNQYERYANGQEVSRDLNEWLTSEVTPNTTRPVGAVAIKPRGLRSFTENDSDFFLELLPGFRDRYGIPECVSFWIDRIHTSDPAKTFPVGMIMGKSGSGKSSLVKAGIIPLLHNVTPLHLEATPEDTETRLLHALKTKLSYLKDTASLTEALIKIRRSGGQKVVIFVDQFEQWLSANQTGQQSELTLALRQCDGGRLQAILIVRDDFGQATRYLTNDLDIKVDREHNYAAVDLFEPQHAKKVLIKFGQAFGKFPESEKLLSSTQSDFIDQVIAVFLRDSKDKGVMPVQIALFAEMIKTKPWETQTLKQLGGQTGILGTFLDDAFGELNPQNRPYEVAAKEVLKALLPPVGGYLKGHGISKQELMETCGYVDKPSEFRGLLSLLDGRLRLIKTAMEQQEVYQLTHDYLVAPLREWLSRKQRETLGGRAEHMLWERAEAWSTHKESKQLPTFLEWIKIRSLTKPKKWSSSQRLMMQRSDLQQCTRLTIVSTCAMSLLTLIILLRAFDTIGRLKQIEYATVPRFLGDLKKRWDQFLLRPLINAQLNLRAASPDELLKYRLAKLVVDPSDRDNIESLKQELITAEASKISILIDQLEPSKELIKEYLWEEAFRNKHETLLQCASALAKYDYENQTNWLKISESIADRLVEEPSYLASTWSKAMQRVKQPLAEVLTDRFKSKYYANKGYQRDIACGVLVDYVDQADELRELMLAGEASHFVRYFAKYQGLSGDLIDPLKKVLTPTQRVIDRQDKELLENHLEIVRKQARAATAIIRLAKNSEARESVYRFLTVDTDPENIAQFIHAIPGRIEDPKALMICIDELLRVPPNEDARLRQQHYLRLYGFVLGIGEFSFNQLPLKDRDSLADRFAEEYRDHKSRTIHSALGWTLRRWGKHDLVNKIDQTEKPYDPEYEWYVLRVSPPKLDGSISELAEREQVYKSLGLSEPIYFTMIVFPPGEFSMGSKQDQKVQLTRHFAICDREVTEHAFYTAFRGLSKLPNRIQLSRNLPKELDWDRAVLYCINLTRYALNRKDCYLETVEDGKINYRMNWDNNGLRLPVEAEWEYAVGFGTTTPYSFGSDPILLGDYSWYRDNSDQNAWEVATLRPCTNGLFDAHGNAHEHVQDFLDLKADTEGVDKLLVNPFVETFSAKFKGHVIRGGSWYSTPAYCKTKQRFVEPSSEKFPFHGFRIATTIEMTQ